MCAETRGAIKESDDQGRSHSSDVTSTPRRNPSAAREIAEIGDNKLAH
jgi:hypothetical protein